MWASIPYAPLALRAKSGHQAPTTDGTSCSSSASESSQASSPLTSPAKQLVRRQCMPSHHRTNRVDACRELRNNLLLLVAALPLTSGSGEVLKPRTDSVITLCTVFVLSLTVQTNRQRCPKPDPYLFGIVPALRRAGLEGHLPRIMRGEAPLRGAGASWLLSLIWKTVSRWLGYDPSLTSEAARARLGAGRAGMDQTLSLPRPHY